MRRRHGVDEDLRGGRSNCQLGRGRGHARARASQCQFTMMAVYEHVLARYRIALSNVMPNMTQPFEFSRSKPRSSGNLHRPGPRVINLSSLPKVDKARDSQDVDWQVQEQSKSKHGQMTQSSKRRSDVRIEPELPDHREDEHGGNERCVICCLETETAGWNRRDEEGPASGNNNTSALSITSLGSSMCAK